MRTALTLDDDVAVALERLRRRRDASFKDIVNNALRRGLSDLAMRRKQHARRASSRAGTGAWTHFVFY
jgi:hypothetical protein